MEVIYFIITVVLLWVVLTQKKKLKHLTQRFSELETMVMQLRGKVKAQNETREPVVNVDETFTDSSSEVDQGIGKAYEQHVIELEKVEASKKTSFERVKKDKEPQIVKVKKPKEVADWRKNLFSVESIISKLGILMLLIGVGYIYKLAYDNGYITEELAVLFGIVIGAILLYLGKRVNKNNRKVLSQVLYGGSIATFYITTYVAYQGYDLIPGLLALMFMIAVTGLGFVIAMVTNSVAMSIIAVLGGLLTPFVLSITELGLLGTGIYILVLSIAGMAIYIFKRWRLLQVSTIVGVTLVTSYFVSLGGMTDSEKVQLALLMTSLLLLFIGIEYTLAYMKVASSRFTAISYGLMAGLPLITLLQVWMTLELKDVTWSIILGVVALIYVCIVYFLNRGKIDLIVENIALSHTGIFALLALILYFGGDIRVVAIMALALIYYALGRRIQNVYMAYLGHILSVIAFLMAMTELIELTFDHGPTLTELLVRILIVVLMILGVLLNKSIPRLVMGIAAIEVYLLSVLQIQAFFWSENWEPLAVMILVQGIFVVGLYFINKKAKFVPILSIFVIGTLPFMAKVISTAAVVYMTEVNGYEIAAYIIYGVMMYLVAQLALVDVPAIFRIIVKLLVYSLLFTIVLGDLVVGTQYMAIGLFLAGAVFFLLQLVEPDRSHQVMSYYLLGVRGIWLLWTLAYMMSTIRMGTFEWQTMVLDLALLPMLWLNLKHLKLDIPTVLIAGVQGVAFMVLTYKNLQMLTYGKGFITLLWAAYAIALLAYSVIKANKQLVTLSLAFIVAVAGKYIIIDLVSVSTLWKIIISMAFGSALLLLSYFLQPILSGQKELDNES